MDYENHSSSLNHINHNSGVKKNYKLISRILFLSYHLSGMLIAQHLFLPTLPGTAIKKSITDVNEQLTRITVMNHRNTNQDIHGISACKVYPPGMLPKPGYRLLPCVFTLTLIAGGHFLWHCLSNV